MLFDDRAQAGAALAVALDQVRLVPPVVVTGLPRGGVPIAAVLAERLGAELDVILVRKLGVPGHTELAMGAIGEGGARVLNSDVIRFAGVGPDQVDRVEAAERVELERRAASYRGDTPPAELAGHTVVIVDDGIATGATVKAAIEVARAKGAARVVVAAPVAPPDTEAALREVADDVVVLATPEPFVAVGRWYRNFDATSDAEVARLLRRARRPTDAD